MVKINGHNKGPTENNLIIMYTFRWTVKINTRPVYQVALEKYHSK